MKNGSIIIIGELKVARIVGKSNGASHAMVSTMLVTIKFRNNENKNIFRLYLHQHQLN